MLALHEPKSVKLLAQEIIDTAPNEEGFSRFCYDVKALREAGLIAIERLVPRRGATEHVYKRTDAFGATLRSVAWSIVEPWV